MRKIVRILASLAMAVGLAMAVVGPASPAAASGCHVFNTGDGNLPNGSGYMAGDYWTWSPTFTVPSWSTCHDIQVRQFSPASCSVAETYYDSVYVEMQWFMGGQWVFQGRFTLVPCHQNAWKITATDVLNGTKYRFVVQGYNPFVTDVMD